MKDMTNIDELHTEGYTWKQWVNNMIYHSTLLFPKKKKKDLPESQDCFNIFACCLFPSIAINFTM